jgi:hypothetical protein
LTDSRLRARRTPPRKPFRYAEGVADLVEVEAAGTVERVDPDDERDVVLLEVVDRREAVLDAAGVDQHDRAEGTVDEVVPEEGEPVLPGVPNR